MNNKTIKEKYLPPTIEVIEMESEESVMTGSNITVINREVEPYLAAGPEQQTDTQPHSSVNWKI